MPSAPLGPVEIGAREIYDLVQALRGDVRDLCSDVHGQDRDLADHEARLRVLERGRWPLPALAVLVAIASLVVAARGFTS